MEESVFKNLRFRTITFLIYLIFDLSNSFSAYTPFPKSKSTLGPSLRIRVEKNLPKFSVSGIDLKRTLHLSKNKALFGGQKKIVFNCKKALKSSQGLDRKTLLASIESPTGFISLMRDRYQGRLLVFSSFRKKGCDVVHDTFMESYISSLLAKEMNESWPSEALKAQAVAARTYAYALWVQKIKRKKRYSFHLDSSEFHQVSGDFFDITNKTFNLTRSTRGMVLMTKGGKIVPAFYHAKCGGRTLTPKTVWGDYTKGYKSKKCSFCHSHGKKSWSSKVSKERIISFIKGNQKRKKKVKGTLRLVPNNYEDLSMRYYIGDDLFVVDKVSLRKAFGRKILPSHYFQGKVTKKNFLFKGRGRGHGVGMCQLGALHLAQKGWNYKKILRYYYPNLVIRTIY
ncbi:MAG: hypothetical protein CME68_08920 [Halobacteriovoraceae bacterium]|nr:hypothetical protein [Halobacteriovoraceae bacterium]